MNYSFFSLLVIKSLWLEGLFIKCNMIHVEYYCDAQPFAFTVNWAKTMNYFRGGGDDGRKRSNNE